MIGEDQFYGVSDETVVLSDVDMPAEISLKFFLLIFVFLSMLV